VRLLHTEAFVAHDADGCEAVDGQRSERSVPLKDGLRLSLFTTLTVLGTPEDITISELAIEHYFPVYKATDLLVRSILA
jgi:hypothetical protein